MDAFLKAKIQQHLYIDAGGRAFYKGEPVTVRSAGGHKKVFLPDVPYPLTFDELKQAGARVDVITMFSLAKAGGEGRWKENIEYRKERGIPSNVYVGNAHSIARALEKGEHPPDVTWIGRRGRQCTEVRDTVDQVLDDMFNDRWRTTFSRGSRKAKK